MFEKKEFPILEFDVSRNAKIEPSKIIEQINVPDFCVISFFSDIIDEMAVMNSYKHITNFRTSTMSVPIYETTYNNQRIAITKGFLGAAGSAGQLEELIALGFTKFIVCGGAGVLQKGVQVGKLVIPDSAVRDEGTSYHYIEPSREISVNSYALQVIEMQLQKDDIPYIKAKTWTTDAFYRETDNKISMRVSEGCVTVEMEAAAFFAVSQFRNVVLGQIIYGGDDLSGIEWDSRQETSRTDIRKNLIELSMKICLQL